MSSTVALVFSVFLLAGNAFFVGAEFAVMAARRSQLEPLAEAGSRRAAMSLEALENVASLLACAQLGITVCSVLLGAFAEDALHHLIEPVFERVGVGESGSYWAALIIALLVVVYLHVVLGEMVPKNIAIAGPDSAALLLAPALLLITKALRPVITLLEWIAKGVVRRLGVEPKDEMTSAYTAAEVQEIVIESAREGLLEAEQHGLATRALEFSDRVAADVAVPAGELVTVTFGVTPAEVERLVASSGFSRFPVRGAGGDLVGYLHLKDILYADDVQRDEPVPPGRIRPLALVRPGDEVEDVLATMQLSGAHLARVVSAPAEPGATAASAAAPAAGSAAAPPAGSGATRSGAAGSGAAGAAGSGAAPAAASATAASIAAGGSAVRPPAGSVTGVVFLEDVLEELVGEVTDEAQTTGRRRS